MSVEERKREERKSGLTMVSTYAWTKTRNGIHFQINSNFLHVPVLIDLCSVSSIHNPRHINTDLLFNHISYLFFSLLNNSYSSMNKAFHE